MRDERLVRRALAAMFSYAVGRGRPPTLDELASELGLERGTVEELVSELVERGLATRDLRLTDRGRGMIRVGLIGGVFDILHVGHIETLREAKKMVDVLAVVVARNSTVRRFKGRDAVMDERDRVRIVSSLKYVDVAVLGSEEDFMRPVELIGPDVIFLGYDQEMPPQLRGKIPEDKVVRLGVRVDNVKTSAIIGLQGPLRARAATVSP
ncbi:cytidyltransferase [Candidatus Geothermarchaeota archaeon ex4572_27]|nr:MAG: cytidyltransferase [Candidatus Geothermarchaeota archaeon ex4572_27]